MSMEEIKGEEGVKAGAVSLCPGGRSMECKTSMGVPEDLKGEEGDIPSSVDVSSSQPVLNPSPDLKEFEAKVLEFVKSNMTNCQKILSCSGVIEDDKEHDELDPSEAAAKEAFLQIALHVLKKMELNNCVFILEQRYYGELTVYQRKLRSCMRLKFKFMPEGRANQGNTTSFNKVYTELYILDGDIKEINEQHEVRQIEKSVNRPKSAETAIKCEDIFKPLPQQGHPIRMVLTKGIAGIGKTVLVQKFMLDWSEEKASQDIQLLFSLPFRELNLLRYEKGSFMELLYHFYPDLKDSGVKDLKTYKVLFVLDGLDECRLPLDFTGSETCCDAAQPASVDVLLTNLIKGSLLPTACLWITSRPGATSCIPSKYVDRVTEIRGFSDLQKELYFQKKIEDENLAEE